MGRKARRKQLSKLVEMIQDAVKGDVTPLDAAVKYLLLFEGERICKVRPQYLRYQVIQMRKLGLSPDDISDVLDIPIHKVFRLQR